MKTQIAIITNPEGYNKGFFGYLITQNSRSWRDGGYNTAEEAQKAARKFIKILQTSN